MSTEHALQILKKKTGIWLKKNIKHSAANYHSLLTKTNKEAEFARGLLKHKLVWNHIQLGRKHQAMLCSPGYFLQIFWVVCYLA